MSFLTIDLKTEYRSLSDDIVRGFYIPVLQEAVVYKRAVGFFSSSALIAISYGIEELVRNGGRIQIVASPRLSKDDIAEIKKGYEVRKIIENALLRELDIPADKYQEKSLSYIASLIAQNILDIKIAFLSKKNEMAMYHEKMGIMIDADKNVIAFSGSMNESENAYYTNYEAFDVFCSWTNDSERVRQKEMAFKAIWEDYEPGIETIDFPEAVKRRLLAYNPTLVNDIPPNAQPQFAVNAAIKKEEIYLPDGFATRSYQDEAIKNWQESNYTGIYDMATGTGKTLTALASLEHLFRANNKRLAIIIVCPYQHLVEQWVEDIERFGMRPIIGYSSSSQKQWKKHLEQAVRSFNLQVSDHFCFITTNGSFITKAVQNQIQLLCEDTVFVVDEAHNMGALNYRKYLPTGIKYRLALSATIDRYNDEIGTSSLKEYFGKKCIEYSLRDAIKSGMLTRYYYYPVITYLDEDELEKYLEITSQIAGFITKKGGKSVLSEYAKQLLIKRSRIVAGARGKVSELGIQIKPYAADKHILVYCGATTVHDADDEDMEFGVRQIDLVSNLLGNSLDMRVGRFTSQESAQERGQIRSAFAEGEQLQALVAIRCLDEGVNIPSIKTAFILASSTNPKEYIQRRGRVLRKFPGKEVAEIYDFITLPFPIDSIGEQHPDVVHSSKGLVRKELERMLDFAEIAENPSITYGLVYELKHGFQIIEEDLRNGEVDNDVI
ncbi:MAG: DEAD/DEAH box helicase family protein [Lachnospiraceae bacterium]